MKFIVPLNYKRVFTENSLHDLQQLNIPPEWTIEYVLNSWLMLLGGREDELYENIVDDICENFLTSADFDVEGHGKMDILSSNADHYVELMSKIFQAMEEYLKPFALGPGDRRVETMVLDNMLPDSIVVRIVFEDDDIDESVFQQPARWASYPKWLTDSGRSRVSPRDHTPMSQLQQLIRGARERNYGNFARSIAMIEEALFSYPGDINVSPVAKQFFTKLCGEDRNHPRRHDSCQIDPRRMERFKGDMDEIIKSLAIKKPTTPRPKEEFVPDDPTVFQINQRWRETADPGVWDAKANLQRARDLLSRSKTLESRVCDEAQGLDKPTYVGVDPVWREAAEETTEELLEEARRLNEQAREAFEESVIAREQIGFELLDEAREREHEEAIKTRMQCTGRTREQVRADLTREHDQLNDFREALLYAQGGDMETANRIAERALREEQFFSRAATSDVYKQDPPVPETLEEQAEYWDGALLNRMAAQGCTRDQAIKDLAAGNPEFATFQRATVKAVVDGLQKELADEPVKKSGVKKGRR